MLCQHCWVAVSFHPSRYCPTCQEKISQRKSRRNPSSTDNKTCKTVNRGSCIENIDPVNLDPKYTDAYPGTEEKLCVLTYRATHGYILWHPLDARKDGIHHILRSIYQSFPNPQALLKLQRITHNFTGHHPILNALEVVEAFPHSYDSKNNQKWKWILLGLENKEMESGQASTDKLEE